MKPSLTPDILIFGKLYSKDAPFLIDFKRVDDSTIKEHY